MPPPLPPQLLLQTILSLVAASAPTPILFISQCSYAVVLIPRPQPHNTPKAANKPKPIFVYSTYLWEVLTSYHKASESPPQLQKRSPVVQEFLLYQT